MLSAFGLRSTQPYSWFGETKYWWILAAEPLNGKSPNLMAILAEVHGQKTKSLRSGWIDPQDLRHIMPR
jgi:hypothetical protein